LPGNLSAEIRKIYSWDEEGRLKTTAEVNQVRWATAIWWDKKQQCYLLPLKAEIRKKAHILAGEEIEVQLYFGDFNSLQDPG
jgi:outer membrane biogenesis lipoprotein LolB